MSGSQLPGPPRVRLARARITAIRLVYGLLTLWALLMAAFGPAALVLGRVPDRWQLAAVSTAVWKVLTLGPVLLVCLSGGRSVVAVRVLVVGQLCWLAAGLMSPQERASTVVLLLQGVLSGVIWVGPWLLLSPHRSQLWRARWHLDRTWALAGAALALPLLWWAMSVSALSVSAESPDLPLRELRFDLTGLPLALIAVSFVAATHAAPWLRRLVGTSLALVGGLGLLSELGLGLAAAWAGPPLVAAVAMLVAAAGVSLPLARVLPARGPA